MKILLRTVRLAIVLICLVNLLALTSVRAQEEKGTGKEAQEVRETITDYIQRDTKLKGSFLLSDPELKRVVELSFDHVHESVTRLTGGRFYASVDMRDTRGKLYDLDVYLEKTDHGLAPAKLVIHKVDGKKRD